jgi:hypothetical protein
LIRRFVRVAGPTTAHFRERTGIFQDHVEKLFAGKSGINQVKGVKLVGNDHVRMGIQKGAEETVSAPGKGGEADKEAHVLKHAPLSPGVE